MVGKGGMGMLLEDAYSDVVEEFRLWRNTMQAKHFQANIVDFVRNFLPILKNHGAIITFRDTDEIVYIQNNKIHYTAETEIKQLMLAAFEAMGIDVSSNRYDEALKFIKMYTYRNREDIESWGDIIGFKNGVYLDLRTFYVVKPAISYLRRIFSLLGEDYNDITLNFKKLIEKIEEGETEYLSKIDNDHFAEDTFAVDDPLMQIEIERVDRSGNMRTFMLHIKRDFYKLMGFMPIRVLPVDFDPSAKAPTWEEFIRSSVPPQFRTTLQRFAGYCLLPTKKYGKFLALLGSGSNGKSTFLTILMEIFGEYAQSISMQDMVDSKFALAELEGKLVNIYPDLPKKKLFNTGLFKALITDETPFTVERKFKPRYKTKIMAKFIFGANALPSVSDDSFAFFRRWLIVNFPRIFDKDSADPELLDKLRKEKSGILNWIIAGAYWIQHDDDPFHYPYTEDEIAELYYRAESPVAQFVQDCLTEADDPKDPDAYIEKERLYQVFIRYCKIQGLPSVSQSKFTRDLKRYIPVTITRLNRNGVRIYAYSGINFGGLCSEDGEFVGEKNDAFDWDDEHDFYVPETLPVEVYRVWPYEPRVYVAKERLVLNDIIYNPGDVIDNLHVHTSVLENLAQEGKVHPHKEVVG